MRVLELIKPKKLRGFNNLLLLLPFILFKKFYIFYLALSRYKSPLANYSLIIDPIIFLGLIKHFPKYSILYYHFYY